jgi:hypothetical protein
VTKPEEPKEADETFENEESEQPVEDEFPETIDEHPQEDEFSMPTDDPMKELQSSPPNKPESDPFEPAVKYMDYDTKLYTPEGSSVKVPEVAASPEICPSPAPFEQAVDPSPSLPSAPKKLVGSMTPEA